MNKNVLFIAITFILISSLAIFNYVIDPFSIFHLTSDIERPYPRELFYAKFKKYDNVNKIDNVLLGSSAAAALFNKYNYKKNKLIRVTLDSVSIKNEYDILKNYLDIFPDTKHVYLTATYYSVSTFCHENIPKYVPQKLSFSEIIFLLFSLKTTKESINKLQIFKHHPKIQNGKNDLIFSHLSYPYNDYYEKFPEYMYVEMEKMTFEYMKKMIDLLKEKNIEYTIIIPPYNAGFLCRIYNNPMYQEYIDNYKRFLVQNTDKVYDFAFINKYTVSKIYEKSYLYIDVAHISPIFGQKVFRYFFDKDYKNDEFCLVLNKNNIEKMLASESQKMKQFINNNKDFVGFYDDLTKKYEENKEYFMVNKPIEIYLNDVPEKELQEYENFNKQENI